MSQVSDDAPLWTRYASQQADAKDEDDSEDLPKWMKDFKSQSPARDGPSSDPYSSSSGEELAEAANDDDDDLDQVPVRKAINDPRPAGSRPAAGKAAGAAAAGKKGVGRGKSKGPQLTSAQLAAQEGDPDAAATPAGAAAAGTGAAAASAKGKAKCAAEGIAQALGAKSELPVMLPDKLPRNKMLVELEPAEHQATDLGGDAGAVGRMLVGGKAGSEQLRIDLKGVVYRALVLPLACSALVLNIGPSEAKVESLFNDFVRLREESSVHASEACVEGSVADLMGDDDDNYQLGGDNTGIDAATGAAKGKVKKRKAAGDDGDGDSAPAKKQRVVKGISKSKGKAGVGKKKAAAKHKGATKAPKMARMPGATAKAKGNTGAKAAPGSKGKAAPAAAAKTSGPKVSASKSRKKQASSDEETEETDESEEWSGGDE